ncbi:hypothetical protein ZWY2020_038832 [Hordeum vulgare]|nr:hypothetical protein ZWY2020_038832 [Hordeum vulgare]
MTFRLLLLFPTEARAWVHAGQALANMPARAPAVRRRPHPSPLRSHGSHPFLQSGCTQGGLSAYRLQELCFHNGDIYIKLRQHLVQLTRRASMLKRC